MVDKLLAIFDTWIRSGDIRDQSRKLSKIAQNFGRFFGPPKFLAAGLPKIVLSLSLLPRTLNFRPDFKFSRLNFFGGTLAPLGGMRWQALVNL